MKPRPIGPLPLLEDAPPRKLRTLAPARDASRATGELWVGIHVPQGKTTLLEQLAVNAQRFTPRVSLAPPDGLLLEMRGSLHLFGGAEGAWRVIEAECAALAPAAVIAMAPTALAALAAARAGVAFLVTEPTRLVGQLARLPLGVLRWPQETLDRLVHIGVRTIGQALRLPRAGFARRFGTAQLESLDRLVGRRADPRPDFCPRQRFRARLEPAYELERHEAILSVLAAPLADLERFLRARQCGITELLVRLHHRQAPATRCVLSLVSPELDAGRLAALLAEKMASFVLPEPVRLCELRSGALVPWTSLSASLWQPGEHGGGLGTESPAFIERLRSRLGAEAIYGLQLFPEHRPEAAWRIAAAEASPVRAAATAPPWSCGYRPLWLLSAPQLLSEREGRPLHRGPLELVSEPERIETGWWDGRDIARDYYVARDPRGARVWIYRERGPPHRWYLHGIFG